MTEPRYVSLEGVKLPIWEERGTGPEILVIPGGPDIASGYLRHHLPSALPGNASVSFVDLRGTGFSEEVEPAVPSMYQMADDLVELLIQRGKGNVVLLGHSFGGLVTLLTAARVPEHVVALILVDPDPALRADWERAFPTIDSRRTDADRIRMTKLAGTGSWKHNSEAAQMYLRERLRPFFFDPSTADRLEVPIPSHRLSSFGQLGSVVRESAGSWDLTATLSEIRQPALIITGPASPYPPESLTDLEARLPDARLVRIDRTGHFPFLEAPDAFREALESFLASL